MTLTEKIIDLCQMDFPCELDVRYDEPMKNHTTFKVGGNADCWLRIEGKDFSFFCAALLRRAAAAEVPVFILGGGANIVVSDKGFRGIVLDTSAYNECKSNEDEVSFCCGTSIDGAAEFAAGKGLSGLEFLAGMPGSIGGAVWMNARCYSKEIADFISWVEVIDYTIDDDPLIKKITVSKSDFSYKKSPYQGKNYLILSAGFKLSKGDAAAIKAEMEKNRNDRKEKGHYNFPCAGSAFKNNTDFGKPTGQIIDELGIKGLSVGGAQVAPYHGNIIINTGEATAADIRTLVDTVAAKVKDATGFVLEPEILFVGAK
jgi:UDP-N-acetylmuramate dehydrogenase